MFVLNTDFEVSFIFSTCAITNLELLLRTAISIFGGESQLKPINNTEEMKVE